MTLDRSNEFRDNFDCNSWNDREIIRRQCFCFFFFIFSFFFSFIYFFKRQNLKHNFYTFENIKGTQSYFFFSRKETSLKDNKRGERYDLDIVCYPCLSIDLLYDFKKVQPMPNQPRDLFLTLYFRRRNHYRIWLSLHLFHFITLNPVKC